MRSRPRRSATVVASIAGLAVLSACGSSGSDESVKPVWDVRESHTIQAVGWPENAGREFQAYFDGPLEQVVLPGGTVVDDAFRANPSRSAGQDEGSFDEQLRDLTLVFPREPVSAVLARARGYAGELGVDISAISTWATDNADGRSMVPGASTAISSQAMLTADTPAPVGYLSSQAFLAGDALLRLTVAWPTAPASTASPSASSQATPDAPSPLSRPSSPPSRPPSASASSAASSTG